MDRDQEKFYEDELNPVEDARDTNTNEDIDDMKYFLELLKHMRAAIETGANVPLTSKKIVDAEMCLRILDDMEQNLPDAVQYGLQMYSEQERILGSAEQRAMKLVSSAEMRANAALEKAKDEAEQRLMDAENEARSILVDAQERADHMVDESEILNRAREEARSIKNDARVEASEAKLKASHEAYQMLSAIEDELTGALNTIRRRRSELDDEAE